MAMSKKTLNLVRNFKGRYDLFRILFKWDKEYKKEVVVTVLTLTLINYSFIDMDSFYDVVALGLELGILFMQMGNEMSILPPNYRQTNAGVSYSVRASTQVFYNGRSFPISEILPVKAEEKLGFVNPIKEKFSSEETPLASEKVDNSLMLKKEVLYDAHPEPGNFIHSSHQIKYLAIKVANKVQHTTNETKLALCSSVEALIGNKPIFVRKSYYFDALLTAEAFRSHIFRSNLRGEEELYTNLTNYFPVEGDVIKGQEIIRFKENFTEYVSGHIGLTSIVLTENNRVAMLFQGGNKVIDGKKVALGGSGSMDYNDIDGANYPRDFRDVLIYGMARETSEEAGLNEWLPQLQENTLLTGFFRWVDRCGKPEFIGVTRVNKIPFAQCGSIDGDEIVKFEEIPITIGKISDFKKVMAYLKDNGISVSLSSLMALNRMIVISGYNKAKSTSQEKKVYEKTSNFLFDD